MPRTPAPAAAIPAHPRRGPAGVLTAIGGTPLVQFTRLYPELPLQVYAKLEALNPGGSAKDRPASRVILDAVQAGLARPGETVVVESSSGNFAIGLAQACRYLGLDLVCVVDPSITPQNLAILRAYGAHVDMVRERDTQSGGYLPARLRRVRELASVLPSSFWPNQYANPLNPAAQTETMREIADSLDGRVDYLFCAVGTCGTLRGCAEFVRDNGLPTQIVAVDAVGSVIFGQQPGRRLIPGHGAATVPDLYVAGLADHVVHVADTDCIAGCRHLVRREAYLAGGSSGAVVSALHRFAASIEPGATCVLILPDRGDRYLDTIYSDPWVEENFGEIPALR